MIIENVDALKSWLAKLLEPICDADPTALANYVVALVKKDKHEKELRALCADQLDVFLQKETTVFVDRLFECLTTKNYLPTPATKEENKSLGQKLEASPVEVDRDNRRRKSPLKNRSDFNDSRVRDERRRDERKRHPKGESSRERLERRGGSSRGRSYSRSRSRSGSRGKTGEAEHNQRRAEHRSKFEPERKDAAEPYNPSSAHTSNPLPKQSHAPPPGPLPSSERTALPKAATVAAAAAHLPDSTTESWSTFFSNHSDCKSFGKNKLRCRDYDEKGFCIRGELCPFDHGNDPLIVDDVTLPNMIPFPPPPILPRIPMPPPGLPMPLLPHGLLPPPGIYPLQGPPLIPTTRINTSTNSRSSNSSPLTLAGVGPPPPSSCASLHPQYNLSEYCFDQEAYNPESPGLTGMGRAQYQQFIPRIHTQRPNLIGLTSGDMQTFRAANIVIKTEASVPRSEVRFNPEQENRKRVLASTDEPEAKKPWMDKPKFNFPKKNYYFNTKLVVCCIPPELNSITKLNEHFSKFGTIVNIQVVFGGDPKSALIQYTSNEEAHKAISSIEAVMNNRFIRVFWHREASFSSQESAPTSGPLPTAHKTSIPLHTAGSYVLNKTNPKLQTVSANLSSTDSVDPTSASKEPPVGVSPALSLAKTAFSLPLLKATSKTLGKTGKALEALDTLKKKQEAMKLQQDMRKKKQEMLEKQIECQKMLINRLEKNRGMKAEERASIMKTLKELTEKISQLKNKISPTPKTALSKSKTDAQKEILDAELDFHKRLTSGEDTSDLKRRLSQLQVEATRLGLIPPGHKQSLSPGRGRGRGRGRSLRGRGAANHMVIDHRPRALAITGFTPEEKEELVPHFLKFGEIEDLYDADACCVVMTFRTRSEAENVANQGAQFKGRILQLSWYKPKIPSVSSELEEEESKDQETNSTGIHEPESPFLLPEDEEDDEEEDEDESRSWRR